MSTSNACRKSVTKKPKPINGFGFFFGFSDILNRISDNKKGRRYATTLVSFYSMVDEMTGSTPACVQSSHSNVSLHNWCARLPDAPKLFYLFPTRKSMTPCQRLAVSECLYERGRGLMKRGLSSTLSPLSC